MKKNYNIQLLRIIAAFLVVSLHIVILKWYSYSIVSIDWNISNIYNAITRTAVPMFFMISGSLLLTKKEMEIKYIFKKYILKMVIIYFVWSTIYAFYELEITRGQIINWQYIKDLYYLVITGPYHFWYIPALIGVYLMLPIMKKVVLKLDEKTSKYIVCLLLVGCLINTVKETPFLPYAEAIRAFTDIFPIYNLILYTGYFILGYILVKYNFLENKKTILYIAGITSFILSIILTWYLCIYTNTYYITYYNHFSIFVFLQVVALFLFFKVKKIKLVPETKTVIDKVATSSLGIYIIHPLIIYLFTRYNLLYINNVSEIIKIPFFAIVIFIVSYLITHYILKKIKYIKDWLV